MLFPYLPTTCLCRGGSEEKWFFAVKKSTTVAEVAVREVFFCRGGSQEKQGR